MSTPASQVTPGGSKLENATKEDLIKLLKRQQMMLKKNGTDSEKERTTLTSSISTLESRLETAESLVAQLRQENDDIYSSNEIITNNFKELESQSKGNQNTIDDLSTQLKSLYNEKEDFLSELEVLRDNKEQMKGLIKILQESESEAKAAVKQLETQLEEEVDDREKERQAWKDNIRTLEDKLQESNIQLEEAQKNVELQKQLYEAKSDIASLKSEGESLKNLVKEYNEQFAIESSTISQVLSSLNSQNVSASETEVLENEVKELRHSVELLAKQEQDNEETILKQQAENHSLLESSTGVNEVSEYLSKISDLKEKLVVSEEEKRRVKLHLDQFISENANLAEQCDVGSEITELRCVLEERDTHISELSEQIEIISSQREELRKRISELQEAEQDESKSESDSLRAELETLREERDSLSSSVFLLEEQTATLTESVNTKQAQIEEVQRTVEKLSSEVDELNSENDVLSDEIEQLKSELLSEETRIETMIEAGKESAKLVSDKELEIVKLREELNIAIETNNRLKEDTQGSHHLMDMELADYQRAADTLQVKLNASKQEVAELELEIKKKDDTVIRLNNDMKELEKQHSSLDEMITKLKVLLMKAKKESTDSKKSEEDAKKESDEARHSLEQTTQNLEELKLELSEVQGELLGLKEKFKRVSNEKSAVIKNLETKFSSLQFDIEKERDLKGEISGEFESYKVRVHNVLKQQRTGESVIGVSEHEAIVIQLSKEVELLKCHVHEVKQSRDLVTSQKEELEAELGAVLRSLERVEKQAGEREKAYLDRVGELEETVRQKEDQIYSNLQSAASQRSALTESYTKTLEQTNTSHLETTQMLQSRISRLEGELCIATSDHHPSTADPLTLSPNTSTPAKTPGFARLGAEGMESPTPHVISGLEDILNSSSLSRTSSRVSISALESREDSKVSHLSTLLSESEHNAAALQEQCTVLKGEIRRLENMLGNDHRNVEYLKNIVMKYLNSEPAAREQLVPVLSTVLQLNKAEISTLMNNAGIGKREQVPWTSTWFYSSS